MRTPLALKNLSHKPRRLLVAVSGVTFAVILIFMELGFLNALLESTVQILRRLNGEIVLRSKAEYALIAAERFDIHRLYDAREVPGVADAWPLYLENAALLRTGANRGYPIRVIAVGDGAAALNIHEFTEMRENLHADSTALADVTSRHKFGIPLLPREDTAAPEFSPYRGELNGRQLRLVGRFHLGVDFATDGNLLMTAANFARYFPYRGSGNNPLQMVDLGIVKLDGTADPRLVLKNLQQSLPSDVEALTKDQLIESEKTFWKESAPLGYIFMVGAVMGFVVGVVICYQIVYADIADHMREFATLKAIGYSSAYFFGLVLEQCFYLALLGFVPGLVISDLAYRALAAYTGLTMGMSLNLVLWVFIATTVMCSLSGLLAVSKLLSTDPAELF